MKTKKTEYAESKQDPLKTKVALFYLSKPVNTSR